MSNYSEADKKWFDRLETELTYTNFHDRYLTRTEKGVYIIRSYSYPKVKDITLGPTGPDALETLTYIGR